MDINQLFKELGEIKSSLKSAHKRLDDSDKLIKSIYELANETKHMREDVNEMQDRILELENQPKKRYELIIATVITAIIGGVIGYLI